MAAQSNDPILLCRAGQDYYKAGKYTEAKRVYKAATNRAGVPDDIRAQCMHGLALCYWETGLKNAARRLMLRVSEEYPNTQAGMKARGSLYLWSQGD
jgi:TolA-binding protein